MPAPVRFAWLPGSQAAAGLHWATAHRPVHVPGDRSVLRCRRLGGNFAAARAL